MKNAIMILFLLPVIAFSQPFDTGVRTDIENSWTAGQTFVCLLADSMLIPISGTILFGDAETELYEATDDRLVIKNAGTDQWQISSTLLGSNALSGQSPAFRNSVATSTNPTVVPDRNDYDTGGGSAGADQYSLIAGGVEGMRIAEGAGNNSVTVSLYGDVVIDSSGSFSGNPNIRGSDGFDGTVITDTILNDDFTTGDMFYLQFTGAPGDSIKPMFADCREDTVIVRRAIDGDADQPYNWWR